MQSLQTRPLSTSFGAEALGIDLAKPLSDDMFQSIEHAFDHSGVLVLRDQNITEEQHVAFSRRFGDLEIHVRKDKLARQHPEIFVVSNVYENGKPIGSVDAGQFWHTDLSYMRVPSRGSLLLAREVPVKNGVTLGDTLFASMTAAYDGLPDDVKRKIQGLKAVHHYEKGYNRDRPSGKRPPLTDEQRRAVPDVEHPLVIVHPRTGRKCLFINEGYTTEVVGLPKAEGEALLAMLFEHCAKPEFLYRHNWRVGDLVMWDNFSTQHKAIGDYSPEMRRRMDRTTLMGSVPVAA